MSGTFPSAKAPKMSYQFKLDRIQLFLVITGFLLTCVLCFTLGLMLGYQLIGSSIKKLLPTQEEVNSYIEKSRQSSFYDTLVEEPNGNNPNLSAPVYEKEAPIPTSKYSRQPVVNTYKQTGAITSSRTPVPVKKLPQKTKPKPAVKAKPNTAQKYVIQVAAFKNRTSAYKLKDELTRKGYPAYVYLSKIDDDNIWFRVRIGKFTTLKEAKQRAKAIKAKTKLRPFIVPK